MNPIDEFKKSLRSQLRERARASYGKSIKALTKIELEVSLNFILQSNYGFWKMAKYGSTKDYKKLFRDVFKNELKTVGVIIKS